MAAALTAVQRRVMRAALRPRAVWLPQAGISHAAERLHLPPQRSIPPPAKYGGRHTVTLIPGDGIGPELMLHVKEVFRHACVPVDFEEVRVSSEAPEEDVQNAITAIRRNGVALKGNIETNHNLPPSHKSRNNLIRTSLDLYANVIHCRSLPGVETRHRDIDILIVRENTEGEYSSLEHEVCPKNTQNHPKNIPETSQKTPQKYPKISPKIPQNILIVRENTEGEYSSLEHEVCPKNTQNRPKRHPKNIPKTPKKYPKNIPKNPAFRGIDQIGED
uniref:isocitrate dehydrogenase [NAD] subunit gamma, mitochondrial n=1 Tax=Lonchura striata TaxID=40157 RepID=UPI0012934BA6|nr:isocitrate dehydrogenase [NAD] subunit gamma, mitochondrial [Lonchura striata domestica]